MSIRDAELKVLEAANARFEAYLKEMHYNSEQEVLRDKGRKSLASSLIWAVAEWRIAKRNMSEAEKLISLEKQ